MRIALRSVLALCCFAALTVPKAKAAVEPSFRDAWQLQSSCNLHADGASISARDFALSGWTNISVPSTVLAAQVAQKQLPDPYYGDNLKKLPGSDHPDGENFSNLPMPQDSPYRCGWWYRKSFPIAAQHAVGSRTWLHFGGINYRGELWVNGRMVAGKDKIAGAYRTYDFDVTDYLQAGQQNVVAVQVFAPTEKDLGINWVDWNPCPPDKDMGLWGDVDMITTGAVTLRSPMAVTHFTDSSLRSAEVTVYAEVQNTADHPVQATVKGTVAGIPIEQTVELRANEVQTVIFTPKSFPSLHFASPKPWWPAQMGEPHLERLKLAVQVGKIETDAKDVAFGFREMTSELTANGSRLFRVNGKPILIRGAGWTQDMLLRNDEGKVRDQMRMVRDMHLNTIRLEGKLETDEFFQLADQQGLLVMLGWCCCDHWEQWSAWTDEDQRIATASLHDQLLRLRHHASLLVWLNGSDNAPPEKVERAYLDVEAAVHWPNPVLASASATVTEASGPSGVKMTGPYDYVEPSYWYVDQKLGGAFGFNTETSPGPAIPSLASRKRFLPDAEAWPATSTWKLHNGRAEFSTLRAFDEAMAAMYAKPNSAAAYERMAQTMEYDSERAMFEAYSRNKYTSTGVVQWMLNDAWPSMIWHLYDYYLDAGAGYFATKKACEPIHIQYSYDDRTIAVVNSTYAPRQALHASISVRNLEWQELFRSEHTIDLSADSVQQVEAIPLKLYQGTDHLLFFDLKISDENGAAVSRNFYWVPVTLTSFDWQHTDFTHTPAERYEDLTALTNLPSANIEAKAKQHNTANGKEIVVALKNPSSQLAFQVHADARTSTGDLIAPVLWSDNWIEIAPGETVTVHGSLPSGSDKDAVVQISGWNVAPVTLKPVSE